MTCRFTDSFAHYTTAQLLRKWTTSANSPSITSSGAGPYGTQGLRCGQSAYARKQLDAQATWTLGFRLRPNGGQAGGSQFCGLYDAGSVQVSLYHNATGTISFVVGTTVVATSTATLVAGNWHYIELKCTIHPSAGVYEVRLNGTAIIGPITGANTRSTGTSSADVIQLGMNQGGAFVGLTTWDFADVYVNDANGSLNAGFLGDCRVECLYPDGAGANTTWTPDSGSNYARVNEAQSNDDTSYVEDSNAGDRDTYSFGNLSSTPANIWAVQTVLTARKTDAGVRTISDVAKSGATTSDGPSVGIGDSYSMYRNIREVDPNTSAAWTATALNAAEFGEKLVS